MKLGDLIKDQSRDADGKFTSGWGVQGERVSDSYSMGVKTRPHSYGKCKYCGEKSAHITSHAEADYRDGARVMSCDAHKDKAEAEVGSFYAKKPEPEAKSIWRSKPKVKKSDQARDPDGKFTSGGSGVSSSKDDIKSHRDMIHRLQAKYTKDGTKPMSAEQHAEIDAHNQKLQEMLDARPESEKWASVKLGDLVKVKDESGHEHSSENGQFVSVGGSTASIDPSSGKGSVKTKAGSHYEVRPQKDGHSVHQGDAQVGEIKQTKDAHQARSVAHNGKKEFLGHFKTPHGAAAALAEKHEHGAKAKAAQKPQTDRERIEDEHTNPETGAVDHDAAVSDRKRQGFLPPSSTLRRKAVFMIGGGGVGKGGVVEDYTGNEGKTHHRDNGDGTYTKEIIGPGHEKFKAYQPGFKDAPVFDSDAEKKNNPMFSHEEGKHPSGSTGPLHAGRYGPSGPKSWKELEAYPEEERAALDAYIQRATGFRDARDFANNVIKEPYGKDHPLAGKPRNEDGKGEDFGGGLTHEISSHVVKERLKNAIRNPDHGSFVYDSTGSDSYKDWAQQAMANGYDVEFNEAQAPREVAHMRNADRERTVPEEQLNSTHDKVARIAPGLKEFALAAKEAGLPIDYKESPTSTAEDLAEAHRKGFTATGAPKGYVSDKKRKKGRM